jgi:hypothetical protein
MPSNTQKRFILDYESPHEMQQHCHSELVLVASDTIAKFIAAKLYLTTPNAPA